VALYKKKVIGGALMTPQGYITYIAVHPEWRGAKVGEFMLYHLIQVPN
jgi:ribosomal protein S18 acetylase RimI-like enzyme